MFTKICLVFNNKQNEFHMNLSVFSLGLSDNSFFKLTTYDLRHKIHLLFSLSYLFFTLRISLCFDIRPRGLCMVLGPFLHSYLQDSKDPSSVKSGLSLGFFLHLMLLLRVGHQH